MKHALPLLLSMAVSAAAQYCEVGAYTPDPAAFQKLCAGKLANCMFYGNWNDPPEEFRGESKHFQRARQTGSTPWIKWSPVVAGYGEGEARYGKLYDDILAGQFDDYLKACAAELAQLKTPIRFDFAHEMNGSWKPYGGPVNGHDKEDGARKFVAVWRRVHDIFTRAGATNCLWVWAPNALRGPLDKLKDGGLSHYYPGDAYVDEIGFSVYNKGKRLGRSFPELFRDSYNAAEAIAPGKPVVISEMGCSADDPKKAAWVLAAFACLPEQFPRVRAFNWFNRDVRVTKGEDANDHRIDADPAVAAAMTEAMNNPYFTGTSHVAEQVRERRANEQKDP